MVSDRRLTHSHGASLPRRAPWRSELDCGDTDFSLTPHRFRRALTGGPKHDQGASGEKSLGTHPHHRSRAAGDTSIGCCGCCHIGRSRSHRAARENPGQTMGVPTPGRRPAGASTTPDQPLTRMGNAWSTLHGRLARGSRAKRQHTSSACLTLAQPWHDPDARPLPSRTRGGS
jgi:hypothetical protein